MQTHIKYAMSGLLAAGTLVGLSACDNTNQSPAELTPESAVEKLSEASGERSYFEDLMTASFGSPAKAGAEPVDFAAAFVDLPEGISLKTGEVSLDEATGATRVEDFAIVYDLEGADVGLMADEALFYGFDPLAIAERIRGENTGESIKVADRIELRQVKSVGMEAVSELLLEEYADEFDELSPLDVFSYNFEVEKLLLDGFVLEPFVFAEIEPEPLDPNAAEWELYLREDDIEDREGLQMLGAFARSFSFDALTYKSALIEYSFNMDELDMDLEMSLDLVGTRDYKRGDLGFSGSWGGRFDGSLPLPDETSDTYAMKLLPMRGELQYSAVSDLKLARAFEALADWKMPDSGQTDFMSLGTWEIAGYNMDMAEKEVLKAGRIFFDTDFHWLLPTRLDLSMTDVGYNVNNIIAVMTEEMGEEFAPGVSPEDVKKGLAIAEQYGFDCFCGDGQLKATWDEGSGDLTYRESGNFSDAFKTSGSLDMTIQTPAETASIVGKEDAEELFGEAFQAAFEFRSFEYSLSDTGGLTNLFDMLHAIGEAFPEQPGMAMLAYNDATQLRALAVDTVIGMKPMVRQEAPGADPFMDAVAAFLEEGGNLTFAAKPPRPITKELIDELEERFYDEEPEPEEMIEIFGLSVTHTK